MTRWTLPRLAALLPAWISLTAGAALPTVPMAAAEPVRSFGMGGLLQAAFGLAMVLALIVLCGWAARRLGLRQPGSSHLLKIVSSTMVGQRERVVVVEVGGQWLVLGVAAGQVRALHTMPAESLPDAQAMPGISPTTPAGAFARRLLESLGKVNQPEKRA